MLPDSTLGERHTHAQGRHEGISLVEREISAVSLQIASLYLSSYKW